MARQKPSTGSPPALSSQGQNVMTTCFLWSSSRQAQVPELFTGSNLLRRCVLPLPQGPAGIFLRLHNSGLTNLDSFVSGWFCMDKF